MAPPWRTLCPVVQHVRYGASQLAPSQHASPDHVQQPNGVTAAGECALWRRLQRGHVHRHCVHRHWHRAAAAAAAPASRASRPALIVQLDCAIWTGRVQYPLLCGHLPGRSGAPLRGGARVGSHDVDSPWRSICPSIHALRHRTLRLAHTLLLADSARGGGTAGYAMIP